MSIDIDEILARRRSFYPVQFSGQRIEDKVIHKLLQSANWAPTHKYTEPWRFKVFCARGLKRLIAFPLEYYLRHTPAEEQKDSKIARIKERKNQISHSIAIVMHRDSQERVPEVEEICSVACAVQNIYLSCLNKGIGGYWSTGAFAFSPETADFLNLNENEKCLGFFQLGMLQENAKAVGRRGNYLEKIEFIEE